MQRSETYNTKQKGIILDVIKKQKNEFSAKDIYNEVKDLTGLTTIYRFIDKLVSDGILNKTLRNGNTTYYQYLTKCNRNNHFYLKCITCGNLTHIDCDCIKELTSHITKHHKFRPNKDHIVITGICNKCYKNN